MNSRKNFIAGLAACGLSIVTFTAPAQAAPQTITFSQTLLNSCLLGIGTNGTLNPKAGGTELNSEAGTGISGSLTVVAIGAIPKITFSAPQLSAPAGDTGSAAQIKYTSLSGANQAYTAAQSSYTSGALLLDNYSVDAKVTNATGFVSGTYQVSTTATCQQ
jgi:hypothetical protein